MDATKLTPRITIGQLAIAVGVTAIALASILAADVEKTWMLFAGYFLTLASPLRRHTFRWCPLVIALAVVAVAASRTIAFSASRLEAVGLALAGAFGFVLCIVAFSSVPPRTGGGYDRRYLSLWVACLLGIASIPFTNWPLRLSFGAMKGEFEAIAAKASQGQPVAVPIKVGPCFIRRVEMRDGRPCLWTDTNSNGFTGFVRNPYGYAKAPGIPPNLAFNLWSGVTLDGDWAFISED